MSRHFVPLLLLSCLIGCTPQQDERAARDLEVGKVTSGGVQFEVVSGLAAVRSATAGSLVLWAGAPVFEITAHSAANATSSWTLSLQNVIADGELVAVEGATVTSEPDPDGLVTRRRYAVELGAVSARLRFAPPDADDPSTFRFAVLSDIQEAIDRLQDIHQKLNEDPTIRFLLGAGDLTQRGRRDQLERYQTELRTLHVPYYTTLGNHELGENPTLFHDYFGRGNFHFVFRGVEFTELDSASATLDPTVYGWLDGWLARASDHVHIVAMHIPPIDPIGVRNGSFSSRAEAAKLFVRLANGHVDLTLYGHIHSYYEFENGGIPAYISGGGGAVPERFDGIGRHFLVIDVDASAVRNVGVVRVD